MPRDNYYLPQRRLVSQQDQAMIARPDVPRSRFLNQWTRKTAFDAGILYPILVDEVLPGDHLSYNVHAYVRMSTPLFPLFDNQRIDTHFFFVPCRLLWTNWAKFMGEQAEPDDSIDYLIPTITGTTGGYAIGSIFDHFCLPTVGQVEADENVEHNVLPLRAYNKIFNAWFRDQNLQNSQPDNMGDGGESPNDYALQRRAKSHDYFTSALPWPQKFTAPSVPIAGNAPITGIAFADPVAAVGPLVGGTETGEALNSANWANSVLSTEAASVYFRAEVGTAADNKPQIYANLGEATGVAINVFRQAFLIQQLLERDARGGTRYVEKIKAHFGVTNPDFRLQRPEYIGGGQTPLTLTPIAQTAPTESEPLGALGAAGTAAGSHRASYAATEHGYIIGLLSVRTELSYQQGLHRLWTRQTQYDFYVPSLAGLGEQAILRQEIYCTGDDANDILVFGYQERWQEYRTRYSEVVGIMRSTATGTIDAWHLAQVFATPPTLNTSFIVDAPPMNRVLAAGASAIGQQYLADILYERNAVRPVPTFGTPVNLGRF